MGPAAVHAQLLGGTMDFHLLFKAFGPRATVHPPHLGTQHLPHEAQAGGWPRYPPPSSRCLDDLYGPPRWAQLLPPPRFPQTVSSLYSGRPCPHVAEDGQRVQGPAQVTLRPSPVISKGHGPLVSGRRQAEGGAQRKAVTLRARTLSLGHAWPSLSIWPQFVSGTQG